MIQKKKNNNKSDLTTCSSAWLRPHQVNLTCDQLMVDPTLNCNEIQRKPIHEGNI